MDKKLLQHTILEAPYNREVWLEVLKEYFGVRKIHIKPHQIIVDTSKAEYAVELGSFTTIDEKVVGIFEVKLLPQIWIERNRVGLRSLLRQVYKYDVDGALIVFVQDDKWRFSYVSEIRTEDGKKETEPKRYTYLFGKNESSRTAADRFDKLKNKPIYLNDLFESFSVEKLNKDFFKTYKEFYEKFWKYLANEKKYYNLLVDNRQTEEEKKQKPIRDFSKKLLGRIVFLQFLQKKGWMGVPIIKNSSPLGGSRMGAWEGGDVKFLQSLFKNHIDKNKFHSTALKTLFFETLNTKRVNDLAPTSLGSGIKIPYLNGGLFDKDISWQYDFDFPVDLFENLFDFFEQYNFTIDENDPYDNQVGIDPEMLGHIFENLLEENREKGAFYTPKEIVHYMCQESLIEYLHTQIIDNAKEDFNLLVRSNQVAQSFTLHQKAIEINNKLKDVKICDPAIGSGAFPMGLLKEIFECRRLIYPYIKTNEAFNPANVKKEIIQQNIYGVDIENGAVEIARLRFWLALVVDEIEPQPLPNLDYKIMQGNSLLESFEGVDLSNLADMEKEQSFISARKSQFELGSELSLVKDTILVFDEISKQQLYVLINDYYSYDETTNTKYPDKQFIKDEINNIVEGKLIAKFFLEKPKIEKSIIDLKKTIASNTIKKNDTPALIRKKEKNIEKLNRDLDSKQKELEKLNSVIKQLHDLQTRTDKPYFLWHLWFKDVFDKGGFDVIIGNPPYVQLQKEGGKLAKLYQPYKYLTFERTGDIYSLFYERGIQILNEKGILCFITSNKWMRANYGTSTRQLFAEKTYPLLLIDFGNIQVFDTATVDTNILMLQNKPRARKYQTKDLHAVRINNHFNLANQSLAEYINKNGYSLTSVSHNAWVVGEKDIYNIKEHISSQGKPLEGWNININRGIVTGFNDAFIVKGDEKDKLIAEHESSKAVLKPILRGRNISSWYPEFDDLWLIYIPWHFPFHRDNRIQGASKKAEDALRIQYPAIYKHLLKFKDELSARNKTETGIRYEWYALQRYGSNFWEDFEKPKMIYPNMTKYLPFVYDETGIYTNQKCFIATGKHLKYLTCFFNSKLFKYTFSDNFPELQGGTRELSKVYFDKIPVKQINDIEEIPYSKLVDYLVALKREKSTEPTDQFMFIYFEQIANALVFELYFKEEFESRNLSIAKYVSELPNLNELEKPIHQLRIIYVSINQDKHPLKEAIFNMLAIPQIELIVSSN